jgi:preprotein translocase SecF subunit
VVALHKKNNKNEQTIFTYTSKSMKASFPIIPRAHMRIGIWIVVMVLWFVSFFMFQRYSIQFTGGIEMKLDTPTIDQSVAQNVWTALQAAGITPGQITVWTKDSYATLLVQLALQSDDQVQQVTDVVKKTLTDSWVITTADSILEQSIIGPSIWEYMKRSATLALFRWLLLMSLYILIAFRVMRHLISPALLWVITVLTMFFDLALPAGMYGLWMSVNPVIQVDAIFIIALLTIMWYSINDTIIIFDRVRENYVAHEEEFAKWHGDVGALFEKSLRQTMKRSLWTSFTTFLVVVAMWIFWTWALKLFAFTFGVGVLAWSFSSIFFAAPLAYLFSKRTLAKKD